MADANHTETHAGEEPDAKAGEAPRAATKPTTNLGLVDIVLTSVADRMRSNIKHKAKQSAHEPAAEDNPLDGRAILSTLTLYGASKLARRSMSGLAMVAGGTLLKALYDRGKAREQASQTSAESDQQE